MTQQPLQAPLTGIKIIEMASLAAAPFGCMLLADMGADLVLVDRPPYPKKKATQNPVQRSRRSIVLDLKDDLDLKVLLRLVEGADVLVEGFRPGVAERLGFGPEICLARNKRLIYARMTGWGQSGPLAAHAGHDIDYIALAGLLGLMGPPIPPLNFAGDLGGGGMLLAVGILAALVERGRSGLGQVLDVAMADGAALMTTPFHGLRAAGRWNGEAGCNLVDGGAPFYRCYRTADGRHMAVGAIEPQFYAALLKGLGLDPASLLAQNNQAFWPMLAETFQQVFASKSQAA